MKKILKINLLVLSTMLIALNIFSFIFEIKFIAILQPNFFVGNVENEYLNFEKGGSLGKKIKAVYPILKEKIIDYDWIYDFTEIFDEIENPVYFDFCHLNEKGNEIVANQICEIVEQLNTN